MKVLFVCTGNICRSPMAAGYFRDRAANSGLSHVVVSSAGTAGIVGHPASTEAIKAMSEIGVDITGHRSSKLRAADLQTSDYVLVMARYHLEVLASRYPEGSDVRLLLRAFEKGTRPEVSAGDLADPIGESIEFYRELVPTMRRCLDHFILFLKHRQ